MEEVGATPRYLVEREFPGVGTLTPEELEAISHGLSSGPGDSGGRVQCERAYLTQDRIHLVYVADGPGPVRTHLVSAGLLGDPIVEITSEIVPGSAEVAGSEGSRTRSVGASAPPEEDVDDRPR
jgi:hypothetical protein